MIKQPLTNIFLYEFDLDPNLADRVLEDFLKKPYKAVNHVNYSASAKALYNNAKTDWESWFDKELFVELQKYIDQVCDIHFSNSKLAICDSWLTKTDFGQRGEFHHHPFSIFSGLLYFTDHEKGNTVFLIEDPIYKKYSQLFSQTIKLQKYEYASQPKKGKLIIWDSHINHKISTHTDKKSRYTLAFNTWFTGVVGYDRTAKLISHVVDVEQQNQ